MTAWWPAVAWVLVVVAYAALANAWNGHDPGWYDRLERPSFQPPDGVFALMWPLSFALLIGVGVWFTRAVPPTTAWSGVALLAVSVAAALGWAYLFYVPHRLGAAAVCLALAAILTWGLVVLVGRASPWAALALAPYAVWLGVATALAVAYARLD